MKNLGKRKDVSEPLWWVGEIYECRKCHDRHMLEEADMPTKEDCTYRGDDRDGGGPPDTTYYRVTCPVCKSLHNIRIIEHT